VNLERAPGARRSRKAAQAVTANREARRFAGGFFCDLKARLQIHRPLDGGHEAGLLLLAA
jgi:hypothetical protein